MRSTHHTDVAVAAHGANEGRLVAVVGPPAVGKSSAAGLAAMVDGQVVLNKDRNEFDLFTKVLTQPSCGGCKEPTGCAGGCPAEELVMGAASCTAQPDVVPVCRLWKAPA